VQGFWLTRLYIDVGANSRPVVTTFAYFEWILAALVFSFSFWLLAFVWDKFESLSKRPLLWSLLISSVWASSEFARSWLYGVVHWGPNATLGPHWNFGALGYSFVSTPLSVLSRTLGLFVLGAFIVAFNLAIFYCFTQKYKPLMYVSLLFIAVLLLSTLPYQENNSTKQVNAAVLHVENNGNVNSEQLRSVLVNGLGRTRSDIVILPEYAFQAETDATKSLASLATDEQVHQKIGEVVFSHPVEYGSLPTIKYIELVLGNTNGQILDTSRKQFLIPGGEYLSWYHNLFLTITGRNDTKHSFQTNRFVVRAERAETPLRSDLAVYGSTSCSGIVSPQIYQKLTNRGSTILTNSASLQAFSRSAQYNTQSLQFARFHAVANNRYFLQAAQGGKSYIIDNNGDVIAISSSKTELLQHSVQLIHKKTLYTLLGDTALLFIMLLLSGSVIYFLLRRN
jgi:apolipoprotein N-acyltransferase